MTIPSQLNSADHEILQHMHGLASSLGIYNYLEIGSYLGGSLQYALAASRCTEVVSVDTRLTGQINDERQIDYSYTVSTADMLTQLHDHKIKTDKLTCIDGTVEDVNSKFNVIFIDGEHTVRATFWDAINSLDLLKENGLLLFHDAWIVHHAIDCVELLLKHQGREFSSAKFVDSDIYAIAFGTLCQDFDTFTVINKDNWGKHRRAAQIRLSRELLKNTHNL